MLRSVFTTMVSRWFTHGGLGGGGCVFLTWDIIISSENQRGLINRHRYDQHTCTEQAQKHEKRTHGFGGRGGEVKAWSASGSLSRFVENERGKDGRVNDGGWYFSRGEEVGNRRSFNIISRGCFKSDRTSK